MPEREIAFIAVDLGEREHGEVMDVLLDISEAIDALPGCTTESFGAFPESRRSLVTGAIEAARTAATHETPERS